MNNRRRAAILTKLAQAMPAQRATPADLKRLGLSPGQFAQPRQTAPTPRPTSTVKFNKGTKIFGRAMSSADRRAFNDLYRNDRTAFSKAVAMYNRTGVGPMGRPASAVASRKVGGRFQAPSLAPTSRPDATLSERNPVTPPAFKAPRPARELSATRMIIPVERDMPRRVGGPGLMAGGRPGQPKKSPAATAYQGSRLRRAYEANKAQAAVRGARSAAADAARGLANR